MNPWSFAVVAVAEPPALVGADTAWMLVATALVLLMTPGLAFFYGGLVRAKNALNTMMMSLGAIAAAGLAWAFAGYSLAFAPGGSGLGGFGHALLAGVGLEPRGAIPHLLFFACQGTFAVITVALVSGAVAERMRFGPWLAFSALWTLVVYAPVCHWVWGGGFLAQLGALAVGALAALPSYFGLLWRARTRLDDSLDVVAAHGLGGLTGALLTGVFASAAWGGTAGLLEGNPGQVGRQAIALAATIVWSGFASWGLLRLIALVSPLAVDERRQARGLDVELHGEEAYGSGEGAILVLPEPAPRAPRAAPHPQVAAPAAGKG